MFVGYGCRSFFGASETESVRSKTYKPREENIEAHGYRYGICCTHWDPNASAGKLLEDLESNPPKLTVKILVFFLQYQRIHN